MGKEVTGTGKGQLAGPGKRELPLEGKSGPRIGVRKMKPGK